MRDQLRVLAPLERTPDGTPVDIKALSREVLRVLSLARFGELDVDASQLDRRQYFGVLAARSTFRAKAPLWLKQFADAALEDEA